MAAHTKSGYLFTQDDYAWIYGVHANTIYRWQNLSLPLDDPESLIRRLLLLNGSRAAWTLSKGTLHILADFNALRAVN